MTYREISVSHWQVRITYRAWDHFVKLWTSIIIYIYSFICFNGITPTAVFFLYLFSFAYACESKKRGFTLHICSESPINRGDSGREPSLHRYSPKRHKWRKTVNPLWQKSPKCECFFLQKTQAARPEGAEAHSPGQRPGYKAISNAPCKGKSFKTPGIFLSFCPYR